MLKAMGPNEGDINVTLKTRNHIPSGTALLNLRQMKHGNATAGNSFMHDTNFDALAKPKRERDNEKRYQERALQKKANQPHIHEV